MRTILLIASALALTTVIPAPAQTQTIAWSIERGSKLPAGNRVELTIEARWDARSRSTWSNSYELSEIRGLSWSQLNSTRQPVRFALVRDAGRLDCGGTAG